MNTENLKSYVAPQLIELAVRETRMPKKHDYCDSNKHKDDLICQVS